MTDLVEKLPKNGEVWKHTKTGGHYEITGSILNTITDKVDVKYRPLYPCEWPEFSRQIMGHEKAFLAKNEDGQPRFTKVAKHGDRHQLEWFKAPE